jgi:hypothetical protein
MSADNRLLHTLHREMRRIRSLEERVRELFVGSQSAGATGQSSTSTGSVPSGATPGRGHHNGRYRDHQRQPRGPAATLLEIHEPLTAWTSFAGVVPAHRTQSRNLSSYTKRHARPTMCRTGMYWDS